MNDENPKKKSALDSIVMGAIIGTAIGSAIGMTVAPKKGSETREIIKEKTKNAGGLRHMAKRFLKRFLRKLGKKDDEVALPPKSTQASISPEMKKIPDEMEILSPKSPHE